MAWPIPLLMTALAILIAGLAILSSGDAPMRLDTPASSHLLPSIDAQPHGPLQTADFALG